ncbi:MAG: hypothetical protein HY331_16960 [Chloroflexi bacterium]|nr:hypothetical protein [Chloroflexota bacterium]
MDSKPGARKVPASLALGLVPVSGWAVAMRPAFPQMGEVAVVLASCLVYGIQSIAWPISEGRDAHTYLLYYLDMWNADPMYPMLMLFRTPVAPLFHGILLQVGGSTLAEFTMGGLFSLSILAVFRMGRIWSRRLGFASAIALLLQPSYGALYHTVSSDALFAFGLVLWTAFMFNTAQSPTTTKFVLNGLCVFLLTLTRPSSQVLLLWVFFPLVIPGLSLNRRLQGSLAFLVTSLLLLLSWSTYNDARYGDFAVSRSTGAVMPLYRLFTVDRLVQPANGPASSRLAEAVRADLLQQEPYVSYGIGLDTFFSSGSPRMWADLVGLSDRTYGWDSDYSVLRQVALEAIAAHPRPYLKGVVGTLSTMLVGNHEQQAPAKRTSPGDRDDASPRLDEKGRPVRSEGDLIPRSYLWWLASTPGNSITYDPQSMSPVIRDPVMRARWTELSRRLDALAAALPPRDGSPGLADRLNRLARHYPSMVLFLALGAFGFVLRPSREARVLLVATVLALVYLVVTYLGMDGVYQYRVSLDPLFILFGTVGFRTIVLAVAAHSFPNTNRLLRTRSQSPRSFSRNGMNSAKS